MSKTLNYKFLKYHLVALQLLVVLGLVGCAKSGIHVADFSSRGGYCQDENCTEGPMNAVGVRTVALVSASQVVKSWESCLGVTASNNTRNSFNANAKTIFPAEGEAKAATGPVMLQAMTLAGNLCSELVNREAGLNATERKIFNNVDLGSRENPFSREVVADVVGRISRSCYGRSPASEDTDIAHRAMVDLGAVTPSGNNNARLMATMLCTGLMASTSGLSF